MPEKLTFKSRRTHPEVQRGPVIPSPPPDTRVTTRFTAKQFELLQETASHKGLKVSTWLRAIAIEAATDAYQERLVREYKLDKEKARKEERERIVLAQEEAQRRRDERRRLQEADQEGEPK